MQECLPALRGEVRDEPVADVKEDGGRDQGAHAFDDLALRATESHQLLGGVPGCPPGDEGGHPTAVNPAQRVAAVCPLQHADERDHDKHRFEAFAGEDRQRAGEDRHRAEAVLRKTPLDGVEMLTDGGVDWLQLFGRGARADQGAIAHEAPLHGDAEVAIQSIDAGLERLEVFDVCGDREIDRLP